MPENSLNPAPEISIMPSSVLEAVICELQTYARTKKQYLKAFGTGQIASQSAGLLFAEGSSHETATRKKTG